MLVRHFLIFQYNLFPMNVKFSELFPIEKKLCRKHTRVSLLIEDTSIYTIDNTKTIQISGQNLYKWLGTEQRLTRQGSRA